MSDILLFPPGKEYSICVENCVFSFMADVPLKLGHSVIVSLHDHVSSELFVCGKGSMSVHFDDNDVVLNEGDALLIPPRIRHCSRPSVEAQECCAVSFICQRRQISCGEDVYKKVQHLTESGNIMVYRAHPEMWKFISDFTERRASDSLIPSMDIVGLILYTASLEYETVTHYSGGYSDSGLEDITRMTQLDQIIERNYMNDITIEDIAEKMYLSSRHVYRIVKSRYGKTFRRVITDRRLELARQLLLTCDLTAEKIAEYVGFGSREGFYREFTKKYSITPMEYRKQNSKKDMVKI
ncbi:MAG: helix-turn-helix transcriptional regulator [Ruminococcaceae bacterium]|nr:helix-turn-helix transcriptional regulator [Oscillospiraceae bacterium]